MKYDVVIAPSFAQVETWRKRCADACGVGLFAQAVTTFGAWIADLWELHGDGRAIVGDVQRRIILQAVFAECSQEPVAPGVVQLAASCMRKAAGVRTFEEALDSARNGAEISGLSPRETAFLNALAQYEDSLGQLGLVESGSAAMALAYCAETVFPQPLSILMPEAPPLTWVQGEFFAVCSQLDLTLEPAPGASGIGPAPDGVDVRFAFPAGRLAEPGLVADVVLECAEAGDVMVVCKNPLDLYMRTGRRLSAVGMQVRVQARKPFAQTDFGRAFLSMFRCLHSDPWDSAALSDVVLSPFSGFSQANAFRIDKDNRADRIAKRDDVLAKLCAQSDAFSQLEELASDPEADVLIGVFEQAVQATVHRSAAWRSEQLSAMAALREATTAARGIGAGIDACVATLQKASVSVSTQTGETGTSVLFTTQAFASRMGSQTVASLVVADLTSEDYPVADKDDAAATLFVKLGMPPEESALSRARREFCALCALPTQALVIMRPLGDDDANRTYPSAVLEEFVDAYRIDPSATDDIDNAYRLPDTLQRDLAERGEELLFANARAAGMDAVQVSETHVANPQLYELDAVAVDRVAPYRRNSGGSLLAKPCSSPSQIEAYLECPYKWFATRKLRVKELDEGFSGLEKGSFAHAAFESFYRRFQEDGHAKVDAENIDHARTLMRQVLDELISEQFDAEPGSGRLVYATELERREVNALCDQLVAFLDFEAMLLPTFRPTYFEYSFDVDHAADYGNGFIVGKIDRIDVDDEGHAVIIDYKGSLNPEYEIAGKGPDNAGKVQTRIYAQVVKRMLGLDVVGALYVSYGRTPTVSGAYDSRVLEAAHLPGVKTDKCRCGLLDDLPDGLTGDCSFADLTFDCMLDATEALVADAVNRMCAGDIVPNPSYDKACEYCPVYTCPKRGA